jgi:hypothetical protein
MTIDRWNLTEEIFQRALEKPTSEHSAHIGPACAGDQELRGRVLTG